MRLYITTIAFITALTLSAQAQQVKLTLKYLPQRHYVTKVNMNVSGSVNTQGNSAMADSLKAKGMNMQNLKLALNASGNILINTGAESGGQIPLTMKLDNVSAQPTINGQQIPLPAAMLNGKMVYAKAASDDGKLHIDSVSGKHLPDSTLNKINSMMSMYMSKMQFPGKTFKPGDTFTQDIPLNMPMGNQMMPANATSKVTYHLVKVSGNKAYFDLSQTTNFSDDKHNTHAMVTGSGKGNMVYEIKEQYPSAFQSNMNVNVHATDAGKGGADIVMNIETNGTTTLSR